MNLLPKPDQLPIFPSSLLSIQKFKFPPNQRIILDISHGSMFCIPFITTVQMQSYLFKPLTTYKSCLLTPIQISTVYHQTPLQSRSFSKCQLKDYLPHCIRSIQQIFSVFLFKPKYCNSASESLHDLGYTCSSGLSMYSLMTLHCKYQSHTINGVVKYGTTVHIVFSSGNTMAIKPPCTSRSFSCVSVHVPFRVVPQDTHCHHSSENRSDF